MFFANRDVTLTYNVSRVQAC